VSHGGTKGVGTHVMSHGGTVNRARSGHEYLATLRPWNGRGGFSLDELVKVLKRLDNPQDKVPAVHVAGTNGKGSVSAATASILAQSGYKVGMNISPHLQRINERIVIDGVSCSDEFIGEFAYSVKQAAHKELVDLSFHEAITAVAFLGLWEVGVEWSVIEVGLGGRLDASNVISRPAATAIVTISFDHQAILGDTLGQIAAEKAGIIKAGSPLVTGLVGKEADGVISKLAKHVPHYKFGRDFDARIKGEGNEPSIEYWGKEFPVGKNLLFDFNPSLQGKHQAHNLTVAATLGLVVGCSVEAVKAGVEGVFWPGRLEEVNVSGIKLVLDCAHNPAGIDSFISFLESTGAYGIDLTFGVLDSKNWREMVKKLSPRVSTWRLLTPESDRSLPLEELVSELRLSCPGVRIEQYGKDYERCLREILSQAESSSAYITGSMYMLGRVREMLSVPERPLWKRKATNAVL
jgi:dihydrofolate synthase/folylpolyglutamate synthase